MRLAVAAETFPLAGAFTISRGSRTEAQVLTVTIEADGVRGRGECVPYARYGETLDSVARPDRGPARQRFDRAALQALLPPGAARNAVDCALWDLEAQAHAAAGSGSSPASPRPARRSPPTPSRSTPPRRCAPRRRGTPTARSSRSSSAARATWPGSRRCAPARPRARIIVDANEGWTAGGLRRARPGAASRLGVELVEQPLPAGADEALAEMARPLPVCADESCHDRASLAGARAASYDMVNIKLDKTGGLTEALALRDAARAAGFGVMVGCMVGSSASAMAPAVLVAQGAAFTDLDGPLLLARDRAHPLRLRRARACIPPTPELWG